MIHLYNVYGISGTESCVYHDVRTGEAQEVQNASVVSTFKVKEGENLEERFGPFLWGIYAEGNEIVRLDKAGNRIG